MVTISCIAYAVRTASNSTTNPVKLNHAQQLVAAALGYKSLAAYQAAKNESKSLDEASHFVLDDQLLVTRSQELNLPHKASELEFLLQAAFQERLPSARLHPSELAMDDYIRDLVQRFALNHGDTVSAMAMTNNDGIDEIYLPFDDLIMGRLPPLGEVVEMECDGHISMTPDIERPYSGHKIDVKVRLILERKGKVCIAEPFCEISAQLNYDWARDEDEIPTVSLAKALADELGLEVSEVEGMIDAEPLADESDDGLLYRYVYDFTEYASPEVAKKLMAKYGSLQVEVPSWFFDRVNHAEYS